ncbi:MAG: segregation/condensation protein A [Armatimonadetes bacterium]|nr:segregation/condensation protein A [Armatimonadota bacterium]
MSAVPAPVPAVADDDRRYRGYVVDLEAFSGPLDLLLSLIRREQVDVFDIPIAQITDQYLAALVGMHDNRVTVTGEFMVMAATLMQIKARMLLPRPPVAEGEEPPEDPRAELVRMLLDYEAFREAARLLDDLAQQRSRMVQVPGEEVDTGPRDLKPVNVTALFEAFERVLKRSVPPEVPRVREQEFTVAQQAVRLLTLTALGAVSFEQVFTGRPSRLEVVVTFMAVLDLVRGGRLVAEQSRVFGEIVLRRPQGAEQRG